jgi:hypothetical protein
MNRVALLSVLPVIGWFIVSMSRVANAGTPMTNG